MSKLSEFLRKLFGKELPLWAYGLECAVCQMTLISPQAHYDHVMKEGTIKKHEGKIPILKK